MTRDDASDLAGLFVRSLPERPGRGFHGSGIGRACCFRRRIDARTMTTLND
jgi:hypothetical protein